MTDPLVRLQQFLTWLAKERPTHWSQVQRAVATRTPDDPADLKWIAEHAVELVGRLDGLTEGSQLNYASRLRSNVRRFLATEGTGGLPRPPEPLPRRTARYNPGTPGGGLFAPPEPIQVPQLPLASVVALQEQLSEALVMVARWPALQARLLPVLAELAATIAQAATLPAVVPEEAPHGPECPALCLLCSGSGDACLLCGAGCWGTDSAIPCTHDRTTRHLDPDGDSGPTTARTARTPTARAEEPECPGPDCKACNGEACELCGAGCWSQASDCEHDAVERHETAREQQGRLAPHEEPKSTTTIPVYDWKHEAMRGAV